MVVYKLIEEGKLMDKNIGVGIWKTAHNESDEQIKGVGARVDWKGQCRVSSTSCEGKSCYTKEDVQSCSTES